MKPSLAVSLVLLVLGAPATPAKDVLPGDEDAALVRAHCSGCHSLKLVAQQHATADEWLAMIRWMQETQNLWALEPAVETRIVAYLATHFGPRSERRRAALPDDQMPRNPYAPAGVEANQREASE